MKVNRRKANNGRRLVEALVKLSAYGPDAAVDASTLSAQLGLPVYSSASCGNGANAKLRRAVSEANRIGLAVCSGPTGYYIPTSMSEGMETVFSLQKKAVSLLVRAAALQARLVEEFA